MAYPKIRWISILKCTQKNILNILQQRMVVGLRLVPHSGNGHMKNSSRQSTCGRYDGRQSETRSSPLKHTYKQKPLEVFSGFFSI